MRGECATRAMTRMAGSVESWGLRRPCRPRRRGPFWLTVAVTIHGEASAFVRHHVCEFVLFVALAAPVLVIRPSRNNILVVVVFLVLYFAFSYRSDCATRLRVDDDGVEYLAGGRDRLFLAWSEIGAVVPRHYRGWPAEDALVLLDHGGRRLLVAGVSMFSRPELEALRAYAAGRAEVRPAAILSPLTGRENGVRRPELVSERSTERVLASSIGGLVIAAAVAVVLFTLFE